MWDLFCRKNNRQFFYYIEYRSLSDMENKPENNSKRALNIYEQRFEKLMMLIRIDKMLKKAVITHKK